MNFGIGLLQRVFMVQVILRIRTACLEQHEQIAARHQNSWKQNTYTDH